MTTIAQLTENQFKELLDEYFAPAPMRHKMTDKEVMELADKLNEKINIPFFNEKKERKILIKIVLKVDTFLYDHLPNEFYDLVRSIDDGISDEEAKQITIRLSRLANKKIDIPYIPEKLEYIAIRFIIGIIINAARTKWDFNRAKDHSYKILPPENENPSDADLEGLVLV